MNCGRNGIHVDLDKGEYDLVERAEEIEKRMGREELPRYELEIVAAYSMVEENRLLAGKAIIRRICIESSPSSCKAGKMAKIAADEAWGYHPEVKKEAGLELLRIFKAMNDWQGVREIALGSSYDAGARAAAAADFVEFSDGGKHGGLVVIDILKSLALPLELRVGLGTRAVDRALGRADKYGQIFLESMNGDGNVPAQITQYLHAKTGGTIGMRSGFGMDAGRRAAGRHNAIGNLKDAIANAVTERAEVGRRK